MTDLVFECNFYRERYQKKEKGIMRENGKCYQKRSIHWYGQTRGVHFFPLSSTNALSFLSYTSYFHLTRYCTRVRITPFTYERVRNTRSDPRCCLVSDQNAGANYNHFGIIIRFWIVRFVYFVIKFVILYITSIIFYSYN